MSSSPEVVAEVFWGYRCLLWLLTSARELAEVEVRLQRGLDRTSADQAQLWGQVVHHSAPSRAKVSSLSAPASLSYQVRLPQERCHLSQGGSLSRTARPSLKQNLCRASPCR